jgi:hypothetical protein
MYRDVRWMSVFDMGNKLKHPSARFDWKYPSENYQVNRKEVLCEGELQELNPRTSSIGPTKFYAATTHELLRFSVLPTLSSHAQGADFTSPEAILPLPLPRMELFKDKASWKYGFSLAAHEVTIKLAADSKTEALRWYNALKKKAKVALQHLSRDFDIGKMVGRGTYSKVNAAIHRETRRPYAIKSVLKSKLFENNSQLVCQDPDANNRWRCLTRSESPENSSTPAWCDCTRYMNPSNTSISSMSSSRAPNSSPKSKPKPTSPRPTPLKSSTTSSTSSAASTTATSSTET